MINVCIVGLGAISPLHIEAVRKNENLNLYAVCDIDKQKLEITEYKAFKYTSYDEALKDDKIDSFHLLTPHYLHCEMILKALNAKKHVFCEKPLCINKDELKLIEKAQKKSSCLLGLCFQNRYRDTIKEIKEIINKKTLGSYLSFNSYVMWKRNSDYYKTAPWRGKRDKEGGGVMINQAIHTLDLLIYLFDDLKLINSSIDNISLKDAIEVEDTATLTFKTAKNNFGFFTATNAYSLNLPVFIEIEFEFGKIVYNENLKVYKNNELIISRQQETIKGEKAYWGNFHTDAIDDFYNSINQPILYQNSFENIKKTHEILFQIYKNHF